VVVLLLQRYFAVLSVMAGMIRWVREAAAASLVGSELACGGSDVLDGPKPVTAISSPQHDEEKKSFRDS